VAGPNEGGNLGPFLYTLSGTIGSTYAAVERGIPGIAFSAANSTHRPYTSVSGTNDIATLNAQAAVKLVNQLVGKGTSDGRILPLGYGLNVNLPLLNSSCSDPTFVQTRLTGGAIVDKAVLNETTGVFTFGNDINSGVNACINGDCSLPGETNVVLGCSVAVSVFTTDYDAPTCGNAANVRTFLQPLVAFLNSNGSSSGSSSGSSTNSTSTRSGSPSSTSSVVVASTNAAPQNLFAQHWGALGAAAAVAAAVL